MTHFADELRAQAERAVEAMKMAAREARFEHAAAELVRHMLTTTAKSARKPRAEAIEAVVAEWMYAWHLDRNALPEVAAEMETLTGAFWDYCNDPSDANDQAIRDAWRALKKVHDTPERSLEDQMAWRSMCAHGWWGLVSPAPDGYRDHDAGRPRDPFWTLGCPPECR
ncbi:MAG: hypothetical protein RLO50_17805 [Azospirillaceae bacterium]